jgi:hypothetical protein
MNLGKMPWKTLMSHNWLVYSTVLKYKKSSEDL